MNIDFQNLAVAVLVFAAIGYLGYRARGMLRKGRGVCGSGCSSCSDDQAQSGRQHGFVPIEELTESKPR